MRYLSAIVALSLVVMLHELGHLLAARGFGIGVRRFSFGFGPPILTLHRKTLWVLGAIPFGGSAVIAGMNPHDPREVPAAPDGYLQQAWWKRLLVLAAGSLFNLALALLVLVLLFLSGTHLPVAMTVGTVDPGSVAARAQLRPGDEILSVNGAPLSNWGALVDRVQDHPDEPLQFEVRRGSEVARVEVIPRPDEAGVGRIGVSQQYVFRRLRFGEAVSYSFTYASQLVRDGTVLVFRALRGRPGAELITPVLLVKQASDTAASGWDAFLRVLVHLSIALGLFQLLPFPALDGGRMLFVAIEAWRREPVNPKLESALHALGFVALLAAVALVAMSEFHRAPAPAAPPPATEAPAPDAGPAADG